MMTLRQLIVAIADSQAEPLHTEAAISAIIDIDITLLRHYAIIGHYCLHY
jgi:hypothetical protein